jgi:hypothetical protein
MMRAVVSATPGRTAFLETNRQDAWWLSPLATALGLLAFIVYSTWAAFQGKYYEYGPYLSPFYSPLILLDWWPFSPAFLILWAPGGFRLTCYYYRKAYYRALFWTPAACAVGARPQNYRGERALLFFQNFHRYFLYPALALVVILTIDAIKAFIFADGFGIGVGSLILTLNVIFLAGFTFGCNSLRHIVGGNCNGFSCVPLGQQRYKAWKFVTLFNERHMVWAWVSLFWVGFIDLYVRLAAMGIITDVRLI